MEMAANMLGHLARYGKEQPTHGERTGEVLQPPHEFLKSLFLPKYFGATRWFNSTLRDSLNAPSLGIRIDPPTGDLVRVRELISRSRAIATGKYPSWKKPDRLLQWESQEEAKAFRLLDACPAVCRFAEQPCTIWYLDAGIWKFHIPDIAFETAFGGRGFIEVKSAQDPSLADAKVRQHILTPRLGALGYAYILSHQAALDAGLSLENARFLIRHGRSEPDANAHLQLMNMLQGGARISVNEIRELNLGGQRPVCTATSLALRGYLALNWEQLNNCPVSFSIPDTINMKESLLWLLRALGVFNQS